MPVRNAGPWLEACLSSILAQNTTNWELIAVNDGSTDNSAALLHQWASRDARITVLENTGTGIIAALRTAYAIARGTYITRMDADDIMPNEKLSTLDLHLSQAGKGHVVIGRVEYFSENTLGEGYQNYAAWLNQLVDSGAVFFAIYKECVIPSPCWMMHREDLDAIGAFSPNDYPEDYDLCFRMYAAGLSVIGVQQVLHRWRDHSARASRTDPQLFLIKPSSP